LHTDATIIRLAISATTLSGYGISDAYTKPQIDTYLSSKANSATTLGGYGILDAYTKSQIDTGLASKPNADAITDIGFVSNDPALPYMRRTSDGAIYRLQRALGAATEAAAGFIAIASQALTNARADDTTAITPKKWGSDLRRCLLQTVT